MDFSSDDDLHICGKCKQGFSKLDEWLQHKHARACKSMRSGHQRPRCDTRNDPETFSNTGCLKSQQRPGRGKLRSAETVESIGDHAGSKLRSVRGQKQSEGDEEDGDGDEEGSEAGSSDDISDRRMSENRTEGFAFVSNSNGGCNRSDVQTNGTSNTILAVDTCSRRGRREGIGGVTDDCRDDKSNQSCDDDGADADDDGDDETCSTNGDGRGHQHTDFAGSLQGIGGGDSGRSIITRNLFPIVPCIRKRERPGVVDAGCPSPGSVGGHSPTSGGGTDLPGSVKRKRGCPQKMGSAVHDDASAASEPCSIGDALNHTEALPTAACNGIDASATIATVLPPVHKCDRCRKGFIKISHLNRHMKKKNPCKPRLEAAAYANAVCKTMDNGVAPASEPALQPLPLPPSAAHAGSQQMPLLGLAASGLVDPATATELPMTRSTFRCGICQLDCATYDSVISHHGSQHALLYSGYCRFCGRYCDKKNDLLSHLSVHKTADIAADVIAEIRRVRQTKIERPGLGSLPIVTDSTSSSPSSSPPGAFSGSSGRLAPFPPSEAREAQSTSAVACAVCAIVCEREADLLLHHNGCHAPVGLYATQADLRRGRGAEGGCFAGAVASHSLWKNCFICCLKFNESNEFEDHIIYHRTWVSPRDQHTVGVADSCRSGILASDSCAWWTAAKESRSLICWLCTKPFSQYEAWRWHLSGDHGLRPVYQCAHDACRRVFEAWHELAAHSREHAQHAFVCAVCNRHASTKASLLAHAETHRHLGVPWFPPLSVSTSEAMPSTEQQQQQLLLPQRGVDGVQPSSFLYPRYDYTSCELCDQMLPDSQQLEGHLEQCRRHVVQCVDCGQEVHRTKLAHHMNSGHQQPFAQLPTVQQSPPLPQTPVAAGGNAASAAASTPSDSSTDGKRFACDLCTSAFPVKERLTQHVKNVHGPRKYVCQACGAAFKRSDKLKRHFSLHSDDRPFVCPHPSCGRGFKRADGLRAHARYHEPLSSSALPGSLSLSSPYACAHCDAAFESSTSYALHLRLDHGSDVLDSISENGRC